MIKAKRVDAVVCIGCLIKGETMHFEYICEAVTQVRSSARDAWQVHKTGSQGIMRLNLDTGVPVIFGVLACTTELQALKRAGLTPDGHNHGEEWGQTAVTMANLRRETE